MQRGGFVISFFDFEAKAFRIRGMSGSPVACGEVEPVSFVELVNRGNVVGVVDGTAKS